MKTILNGCTAIFAFAVFCYCAAFVIALWHRVRHKEKIPWDQLNPSSLLHGPRIMLLVILIVGLINAILSQALASTKIGAFYEKSAYTENYNAILYIDEKPIFCIVAVDKQTDGGKSNYWITEVFLPYGHSEYVDAEYNSDKNYANVSLGDWGWDCSLSLGEPATSLSYTMLENTVVSNYGGLCGSKESDTYHLLDCQHVKNINPQNLVYFESQQEAEVLGYTFCSTCTKRVAITP